MKRIMTAVAVMLLCLTGTTVSAQGGYQVKGVVVDAMGPVIGATVMEQGTTNGTSTGLDGDFLLNVKGPDAVVAISCIGYTTQTFKASEVPAQVTLVEDGEFLDEVVVIGYGTVKKSDMTGSVSTVKADEINKGVITTPADLLRGKSAGVVVTQGSGMPGSDLVCPCPMTVSPECPTLCPQSTPRTSRASQCSRMLPLPPSTVPGLPTVLS